MTASKTAANTTEASRRWFLRLSGVAGATALAGCFEDGDDGDNGGEASLPDGPEEDTVYDQAFTSDTWSLPQELQVNPYNPTNHDDELPQILFEPLMWMNNRTEELVPGAVQDWELDGDVAELTLRDGLVWHNGDSVTADDLANKLRTEVILGATLNDFIDHSDDITVVDDSTVELSLNRDSFADGVFFPVVSQLAVDMPEANYGDFIDDLRDAEGDEEAVGSVEQELSDFAPEDPIGCGPFKWESADERLLVLNRFEDHPDADAINFERFEFQQVNDNNQIWQGVQGGDIDGTGPVFTPPEVVDNMPSHVEEIQIPGMWGLSVVFNHANDILADRAVRQAMAYVINREQVVTNMTPRSGAVVEVPSGLTGNFTDAPDEWLGDRKSEFDQYAPSESDHESATTILEDAGYEKQDGVWVDESGTPIPAQIKVPAPYSDWVDAADTVVQNLDDFGFAAEVLTRDEGAYWEEYVEGDFQILFSGWADGTVPHPYFNQGFLLNDAQNQEWASYPAEVEAPSLDGGTETYDIEEEIRELAGLGNDADAEQAKVQRLGYLINQELPRLPVQEKSDQVFLSGEEWAVPTGDPDETQVPWPAYYLPREGYVHADN